METQQKSLIYTAKTTDILVSSLISNSVGSIWKRKRAIMSISTVKVDKSIFIT